MYKAVKNNGKIVEFSAQSEELLTRWILTRLKKEGKNITGSVMQLFLSRTGTDMGNIDRELEKLICYALDRDVITAEDVMAVTTEQTTNKIFEMVTFKGYNNINEVLELKGQLVYVNRSILKINEDDYLLNDLIGMEVFDNDELLGVVKDYYLDNGNTLLEIKGKKIFYIPLKSDYIKNVDVKNKKIITNNGGALIL